MKNQHTPGPWTVRENENGTLGIDAKESDGTYCQPARINGNADDEVYGLETRANARLIASSPDLLAACAGLLDFLEAGDDFDPDCPEASIGCMYGTDLESQYKAAIAAIAKATKEN